MNARAVDPTQIRPWLIAVLWPSFVLAAVATGLLFSAIDPEIVSALGESQRLGVYSIGFLLLWIYGALAIAVGGWFLRINDSGERAPQERSDP